MKKFSYFVVFFSILFILATCIDVVVVPAFADAVAAPPPGESSGSGPLLLILILVVLVGTIALLINWLKRRTKEPANLTLNSAAQQTSSGFLDFGFTRFITNSLTSFIWMAVVAIVFLVWGYQTYTIAQGGLSGGLLIRLLSMTASNPPLMNLLLITLDAVFYLLVARMILEFTIIVFRIETRLRTIEENAEKMSRVASDLRIIRDNTNKYENK